MTIDFGFRTLCPSCLLRALCGSRTGLCRLAEVCHTFGAMVSDRHRIARMRRWCITQLLFPSGIAVRSCVASCRGSERNCVVLGFPMRSSASTTARPRRRSRHWPSCWQRSRRCGCCALMLRPERVRHFRRGLIAIEPGNHYSVEQIPHLVARLSRLDLVVGRLRLGAWRKFWHRIGRIPRWLLLGLEVRQPDCLFWAARREAVAEIHLPRGMRRYLPWLVARRGFRVGDMYVRENAERTRLHDPPANPLDLLTAWWTCRRWRNDSAHEIPPAADAPPLNMAAPKKF